MTRARVALLIGLALPPPLVSPIAETASANSGRMTWQIDSDFRMSVVHSNLLRSLTGGYEELVDGKWSTRIPIALEQDELSGWKGVWESFEVQATAPSTDAAGVGSVFNLSLSDGNQSISYFFQDFGAYSPSPKVEIVAKGAGTRDGGDLKRDLRFEYVPEKAQVVSTLVADNAGVKSRITFHGYEDSERRFQMEFRFERPDGAAVRKFAIVESGTLRLDEFRADPLPWMILLTMHYEMFLSQL